MSKTSTTEQGNLFRDQVAQLLELTPHITNVKTEYPIGSQDVDIYYEESTSIRTIRVACECKDYGKPLTKSYISAKIYPKYHPLLAEHYVDEVQIVAPLALGSKAQKYVEECRFSFVTRSALETNLMDFRVYMHSLRALFNEDGLDQYYIRPTREDASDLEQYIFQWLNDETSKPIAVLGGYGMGKTSFARRVASVAANRHLDGAATRIPILIPLAEISSEQGLEGLLGKLLAAQNQVPNYHFNLFMELNRRGRFFIVLDGFDEMKHTMSWREFSHNFSQLNRLVMPDSRVILLGRPSALMSDLEELFVLRGQRKSGSKTFTIPNAPDYEEIELQPFSESQSIEFIHSYAQYRRSVDEQLRGVGSAEDTDARIEAIRTDDELKSLISRPVQAKMLADLATDPAVEWRSFSRYELYAEFVLRIIQRESRKPTRTIFDEKQRRLFIREVAWWLWKKSASTSFDLDELPRPIVSKFCGDEAADRDGVKRDLVSGSLLERKTGENYYFPHRSFLEFLVAQHISQNEWQLRNFPEISEALNPEVVAFLKESGFESRIAEWNAVMNDVQLPLSARFLDLVAWGLNRVHAEMPKTAEASASPRDLLVGYFRLVEAGTAINESANFVGRSFTVAKDIQTQLMCILCLLLAKEASEGHLRDSLGQLVAAFILDRALPELIRIVGSHGKGSHAINKDDPFVRIVTASFKGESGPSNHGLLIGVDSYELYNTIQDALHAKWRLSDVSDSLTFAFERVNFAELGGLVDKLRMSKNGGHVATFFSQYPDPSTLISVTTKTLA
jgi:NACHT domain